LGQCLSFVVGSVNDSDMVNLAVAAGAFFLAIPSVTYLSFQANDDNVDVEENLGIQSDEEDSLGEGDDDEEIGSNEVFLSKDHVREHVKTESNLSN